MSFVSFREIIASAILMTDSSAGNTSNLSVSEKIDGIARQRINQAPEDDVYITSNAEGCLCAYEAQGRR